MKKSGEDRLKCAVYESTRAPLARSPFPDGEGKEEAASPQVKEANPASRGYSLLPLEGGAPKGRRLDGDSAIPRCDP